MKINPSIGRLRASIASVFIGNDAAIDRVICCMLARGHILIEDVPGVGKTILAASIARSVQCSFSRVQLTPDMLPADLLGVTIYNRDTGEFVFRRGPIFANFILADEINRTTPRTQTALLEAMSEARVSIDGTQHTLEPPFMVIATQNPYDFEGTYPLPENQLDRFLMRLSLGYPKPEHERQILNTRPATTVLDGIEPVISGGELVALQAKTDEVKIDNAILDYIVGFAAATRDDDRLRLGLSPRGSLALGAGCAQRRLFHNRDYVIPEDVLDNIHAVCSHRIVPRATPEGAELTASEHILTSIVQSLESPV
ncbi:MAG: MoxR family ATPase [Planctomycetota bacterium]|nr:MAG: MoxR family ATPase [Planctomycetota bacterium]